jgi:hypothetical protein
MEELLKDGFVFLSDKTPLLKFLLWSSPDAKEISINHPLAERLRPS